MFFLQQASEFLSGLSVEALPGVGYRLVRKLEEHQIELVADLLKHSKVCACVCVGVRVPVCVVYYVLYVWWWMCEDDKKST